MDSLEDSEDLSAVMANSFSIKDKLLPKNYTLKKMFHKIVEDFETLSTTKEQRAELSIPVELWSFSHDFRPKLIDTRKNITLFQLEDFHLLRPLYVYVKTLNINHQQMENYSHDYDCQTSSKSASNDFTLIFIKEKTGNTKYSYRGTITLERNKDHIENPLQCLYLKSLIGKQLGVDSLTAFTILQILHPNLEHQENGLISGSTVIVKRQTEDHCRLDVEESDLTDKSDSESAARDLKCDVIGSKECLSTEVSNCSAVDNGNHVGVSLAVNCGPLASSHSFPQLQHRRSEPALVTQHHVAQTTSEIQVAMEETDLKMPNRQSRQNQAVQIYKEPILRPKASNVIHATRGKETRAKERGSGCMSGIFKSRGQDASKKLLNSEDCSFPYLANPPSHSPPTRSYQQDLVEFYLNKRAQEKLSGEASDQDDKKNSKSRHGEKKSVGWNDGRKSRKGSMYELKLFVTNLTRPIDQHDEPIPKKQSSRQSDFGVSAQGGKGGGKTKVKMIAKLDRTEDEGPEYQNLL